MQLYAELDAVVSLATYMTLEKHDQLRERQQENRLTALLFSKAGVLAAIGTADASTTSDNIPVIVTSLVDETYRDSTGEILEPHALVFWPRERVRHVIATGVDIQLITSIQVKR